MTWAVLRFFLSVSLLSLLPSLTSASLSVFLSLYIPPLPSPSVVSILTCIGRTSVFLTEEMDFCLGKSWSFFGMADDSWVLAHAFLCLPACLPAYSGGQNSLLNMTQAPGLLQPHRSPKVPDTLLRHLEMAAKWLRRVAPHTPAATLFALSFPGFV